MGKIIRNGIEFSSTVDTANNISYDNSLSGLEATTTQKAIDELSEGLGIFPDLSNVIETYATLGTYTIPSDGYLMGVISIKGLKAYTIAKLNDLLLGSASGLAEGVTNSTNISIPVKKGMILNIEQSGDNSEATASVQLRLLGLCK